MMLNRLIVALFIALAPSLALAGSTVNPAIPAAGSSLTSAPVRNNFAAAYNDINNILGMFAGPLAPSGASVGQDWLDTSVAPAVWRKRYNTGWTAIGSINLSTGAVVLVGGGGGGGGISGPASSTVGFVPQWGNTVGTVLGAGLPVGTTGSSTIVQTDSGGHLAAGVLPALTGDIVTSVGGTVTTYNNVVPANKGGAGTVNGALKASFGTVSQASASDLTNGASGTGAVCLVTNCALLGTPTAPTATPASLSNTQIATTAFVQNAIAAIGGLPSLTNANVWIGNGSNVAVANPISGDATLSNTGVLTLATVNSNVGAFGNSSNTLVVTANAKGLITAINATAITAPAGTLTGTALNPSIIASSLTSVGALTAGSISGAGFNINLASTAYTGQLGVPNGGTGTTTFTANVPLIGNGASAITQGTVTSTNGATRFATANANAITSGHCAGWDGSQNLQDAGPCAGGGLSGSGVAGNPTVWSSSSVLAAGGGPCNVRAFGAVGNSSTDDTTAINTAKATCPTQALYFPASTGCYMYNGTLSFGGLPFIIKGDGPGVQFDLSCIKNTSTNLPTIDISNTVGSFITDITLDRTSASPGGDGIFSSVSQDATIRNVVVQHNYVGLNLGRTAWGTVTGVVTQNNSSHGLAMFNNDPSNALQWQLFNIISGSNGGSGYNMTCSGSGANGAAGEWIGVATFNNGSYGINITGSSGCVISNVWIANSFIGDDHNIEINLSLNGGAAYLSNIGVEGGASNGIYADTTVSRLMMSNISINTVPGVGIYSFATSTSLMGAWVLNSGASGAACMAGRCQFSNIRATGNAAFGVFVDAGATAATLVATDSRSNSIGQINCGANCQNIGALP